MHVALTRIHPFADGNGRLARRLASLPFCVRRGCHCLSSPTSGPAYAHVLEQADERNLAPVVDLFLAAHVNTLDLAWSLLESSTNDELGRPTEVIAPPAQRMLLDVVRSQVSTPR